jgi:hypothetical protein
VERCRHDRPVDRERLGRLGARITLGLVVVLVVRIVAIDNLPALVILAPATTGVVVAFTWPRGRIAGLVAAILISGTAVFGLIGGWGYLFVPSIVLLILASTRSDVR